MTTGPTDADAGAFKGDAGSSASLQTENNDGSKHLELKGRSGWNGGAAHLLLAILCIAALGSLATGVRQGLHIGIDFQWSGARLLSRGVDPWKTFLQGDPDRRIILGQQPNYLPELYVLLLPLGRLDFHRALAIWCGANLVFLGISLALAAKLYRLSFYNAVWLSALLLISAPLRVSIANGQQSLFALCCFAVAYCAASSRVVRGVALGLGFAKYSLAPIAVAIDALRARWLSIVCMAAPIFAGLLIVWEKTGTRLSDLLFEPLRSAQVAVSPGYGDIMTALQFGLARGGLSGALVFHLAEAVGLLIAVAIAAWVASSRFTLRIELVMVAIFSLFCFIHLIYDYVFLLFPLAALLEVRQASAIGPKDRRYLVASCTGWIAILYLLLFGTVRNRLHLGESLSVVLCNCIALLAVALAVLILHPPKLVT